MFENNKLRYFRLKCALCAGVSKSMFTNYLNRNWALGGRTCNIERGIYPFPLSGFS